MRFELGLEARTGSNLTSALTIAGAYIAGGPRTARALLLFDSTSTALLYSVAFTLVALLVFGFIKGRFTGTRPLRSALQTAVDQYGRRAAGIARLIGG